MKRSTLGVSLSIALALAGIVIAVPELFYWINSTRDDVGHDWAMLGFFVGLAMVLAAGVCGLLLREPRA
jgi:hypothetical protein